MRIARRRDILVIVMDSVSIGTAPCRPMERGPAFWALWEGASSGDGHGELQLEERCVIVLANG